TPLPFQGKGAGGERSSEQATGPTARSSAKVAPMWFTHPAYMIAGGVLISSPIIIHLINRMRFKRVRWAAMEFLLKSQKRNRRRPIIEQLILLLLRILLVLLAAFLVARFLGAATPQKSGSTAHVVVFDDTPSMGDRGKDRNESFDGVGAGREMLNEMAEH